MPTIVTYLSGPAFSFNEASEFARIDPRKLTVWVQRSNPLRMPVPTGLMMSERKRVFSALEVLQLCVLGQLVDRRTDVGTAAIIAKTATDRFAHEDKVGVQLSHEGSASLVDIGLFVEPADGREVYPASLREVNLLPEIASIKERYVEGIQLIAEGRAPKPHMFIPIGQLAHVLIQAIADRAESSTEHRSQLLPPLES